MNFYNLCLWLAGPVIETLILARAVRAKWFLKYKLFFAYVSFVLLQDISFFAIYQSKYYAPVYWWTQLLSVAMGVGVTYEIFRYVLGCYPGAGKVVRNAFGIILVVTLSKNLLNSPVSLVILRAFVVEIERDLRLIQAFSLLVLVALVVYYRIPLGRNTKGLLAGYGIFLGTSIMTLTLRHSLGEEFQQTWNSVQPLSYLAVLCIWCVFLWNYEPNPRVETHAKIETDYHALAVATRKGVSQAREFLARAIRP